MFVLCRVTDAPLYPRRLRPATVSFFMRISSNIAPSTPDLKKRSWDIYPSIAAVVAVGSEQSRAVATAFIVIESRLLLLPKSNNSQSEHPLKRGP